jgi:lipid II:glycine glycyltransferase (peptidoglycan interpeptide bridge formation enzyme)
MKIVNFPDLRQTTEYANYLRRDGWAVERIKETNYFIRKIPLLGYILKLQRPEKINFETIDRLCRKYRIFQIILEPKDNSQQSAVISHGFRLSRNPYLPSKTLCIDLTKNQADIYKDFQRNIRTGVARGESFTAKEYSTPNEIKIFREAWKNSVNYNRYVPSLASLLNLRKSFTNKKSLFLASHNISGNIMGGVIFTITSHGVSNYITSYMYGFMSKEGRSSLSMASLLYQGILWGKKNGCKVFDFEGIYDDRFPNKSWLGFTRFKKSFGGYEIMYPGCYTRFTFPWKY